MTAAAEIAANTTDVQTMRRDHSLWPVFTHTGRNLDASSLKCFSLPTVSRPAIRRLVSVFFLHMSRL